MSNSGSGEPPNPWSREGSSASDPAGSGPGPEDPYATPSGYPGPFPPSASSGSEPSRTEPPQAEPAPPGFDPYPTTPYGEGAAGPSYGSPPPPYADPTSSYGAPPPAYGSNPYEVSAYQPAYGTSSPYGMVPVSHPQSTTAMIFGILGIAFGLGCGIGGLLGIPGIVLGRRARSEIDAQPGRYGGRSQAVAGIVTGTIGVVIAALVVVVAIIAVFLAGASGDL